MRFLLLGPLEVEDGGRTIEISRPKQRALLAILLLNANRAVSTDTLIEALWEDGIPDTAAKALQVHISHLRRLLGASRLQTRPPGYRLEVADDEFDVHEFELLVRRARTESPSQACTTWQQARSLWRGEPFADLAAHRYAQAEIARLDELRLAAIEGQMDAELRRGRAAELIGELEGLVTEHPLREGLRCQLMVALYRAGRQVEALETYRDAVRVLRDERGLEPSRALRDLEHAILAHDPSLEPGPEELPRSAGDPVPVAFVGREHELRELVAGLEEAIEGHGRLVLVTGEPGIGKSRLAEELIRRARDQGVDVLVGRCWEAGGAPAYWPWVQLLRGYIRELEPAILRGVLGASAADVALIVPELRSILPDLPEQPADPEGARFRLFDATTEFLLRASRRRPMLLVLDDLHAADAPSLLLLRFLVRQLDTSNILVLGALRSVDPVPGTALRSLLADVAREPTTRRLSLQGLAEADVAEYMTLTAGHASSSLVTALYNETEGNPLFVVEMVRLLAIEGGDLEQATSELPLGIPESVRDVIVRRVAHLSDECERMLTLASVLGREFSTTALARLADVSEDDLLDRLDEAASAGVVSFVHGSPIQARFTHVLIRDTLYEGMTTVRRVRLHRLAVDALTAVYGDDPGPHLTELAHHAIAGSDFDRGLEFARRAADRALESLAYEEAARLYQVALDAADLSGASGTTQAELLLAQGDAQVLAGESPAARATLVRAADIARAHGQAELFARAALAYGGRDIWGPRKEWDARYVPFLEEALDLCGERDSTLRARLLTRLASARRGDADRDALAGLTREASEIADRIGDPATILFALDGHLAAGGGPSSSEARFRDGTKLVELATASGDLERVFGGHEHVLYGAWTLGDRQALERTLDGMRRLVEELNLQSFRSIVTVSDALVAASHGRFAEAEELIADALRFGERAQSWNVQTPHRLQSFLLRVQQDRLGDHEDVLRRSIAEYPGYHIFDCALALAYAHLDRRREAAAIFEHLAADEFGRLSRDEDWLVNLSLLSDVCVYLGDRSRARTALTQLTPFVGLNAVAAGELCLGCVARNAGRLATLLGRYDEAQKHFETALEMNARMGARPWLAETQADYAELLLESTADDAGARARMLVDEAAATFEELAMPRGIARTRVLAAKG